MGAFHVFQIAQMVPNTVAHLILTTKNFPIIIAFQRCIQKSVNNPRWSYFRNKKIQLLVLHWVLNTHLLFAVYTNREKPTQAACNYDKNFWTWLQFSQSSKNHIPLKTSYMLSSQLKNKYFEVFFQKKEFIESSKNENVPAAIQ